MCRPAHKDSPTCLILVTHDSKIESARNIDRRLVARGWKKTGRYTRKSQLIATRNFNCTMQKIHRMKQIALHFSSLRAGADCSHNSFLRPDHDEEHQLHHARQRLQREEDACCRRARLPPRPAQFEFFMIGTSSTDLGTLRLVEYPHSWDFFTVCISSTDLGALRSGEFFIVGIFHSWG